MGSTGNQSRRKRQRREQRRREQERFNQDVTAESSVRLPNLPLLSIGFCIFVADASTILLWWPHHRWIGAVVFVAGAVCTSISFILGKGDTDA